MLFVLLPGCGAHSDDLPDAKAGGGSSASARSDVAVVALALGADPVDARSIALQGELLSPDVLVVGGQTIPSTVVSQVGRAYGVRLAVPLSLASVPVADRLVTFAAVEPASFRRFAPKRTATMDAVWRSVARGDVLLSHEVGRELHQPLGDTLTVGRRRSSIPLRVGAFATVVSQIDAVVNDERGDQLGMQPGNALLISVDPAKKDAAVAAVREAVGERARVQPLGSSAATTETRQAAYLTGGALARAVGSFSYRALPDGSVRPDAGWVAGNIRTESVPILGRVTCHRVVLPQLRSALSEVVERGLASSIDPGDFGGCYVPRFIGHDPSQGLSLHTWGIAIDLNVAGNQRGSVGEIDRRVVSTFKRWGFAWGGDWQWTDPMHFELAALVRGGGRS